MPPANHNALPKGQKRRYLSFLFLLLFCRLAFAQTAQKNLDLIIMTFPEPGWYMVSVPLQLSDNTVSTLFPIATSAFAWDKDHYVPADTIDLGQGIWLFIPTASTAVIEGTAIDQFSGHFTPGWHMIGSVIDTVNFANPNDTPDNSILLPAFYWNGFQPRYFPPVSFIEQTFGHWIAVLQECDLEVRRNRVILDVVTREEVVPNLSSLDEQKLVELAAQNDGAKLSSLLQRDFVTQAQSRWRSISFVNLRPMRLAQYPLPGRFLKRSQASNNADQRPNINHLAGASQPQWTIPMRVSLTGQGQDLIAFGTRAGATNSLDAGVELLNPPAPPMVFDAFFEIAHPIFPELTEDFRADTIRTATWNLPIIATGGEGGTITWNTSDFPIANFPNSKLEIRQGSSVLADMLTSDSLSFTGDQDLQIVLFLLGVDSIRCELTILSPQDGAFTCADSVLVTGLSTIAGAVPPVQRTCEINGLMASSPTGDTLRAKVPLAPGLNSVIATCRIVDALGRAATCSDTIRVFLDATPAQCTFNFDHLPTITGKAVDAESGIAAIEVVEALNRVVIIDPFTPGDLRVRFRSERTQPDGRSSFTLKITNGAGCEVLCDPVYLRLNPADSAAPIVFDIPSTDRYLLIENHGLHRIVIALNQHEVTCIASASGGGQNGDTYFIPFHGKRTIDLASFMQDGLNRVALTSTGPDGSFADLLFSDIKSDEDATNVKERRASNGGLPETFVLLQNYPNPFNPETRIVFEIPAGWTAPVVLRIVNLEGQTMQTLIADALSPGRHEVIWNGKDAKGKALGSGVYFCQITSGRFAAVKKMILAK